MGKMNKKAIIAVEKTISPIVPIAVLFIVAVFLISVFFYGPTLIYKYLPDLKPGNISVEGIEKLRYDIAYDKVQYYDGETWQDFGGKEPVELDEKIVNYEKIHDEFKKYYFNSQRGEDILSLDESYDVDFDLLIYSKDERGRWAKFSDYITLNSPTLILGGDVGIYIIDKKAGYQNKGFLLLRITDDSLQTVTAVASSGDIAGKGEYANLDATYLLSKHPEWKEKFISQGKGWRDSVLKKPMVVSYDTKDMNNVPSFVCVNLRPNDRTHIDIDLNQEVGEDVTC